MLNIILFDDDAFEYLAPLTFTRPICELRIGILTIKEKWESYFPEAQFSYQTALHLRQKYSLKAAEENLFINGSLTPTPSLVASIKELPKQTLLLNEAQQPLAFWSKNTAEPTNFETYTTQIFDEKVLKINRLWDIFSKNEQAINTDFEHLTKGRTSQPLSKTNTLIGSKENLFIETGATVECSVLNTTSGKIYIGKDAEIMEGCLVRGPLALCEHAVLKMGSKVYGATTLGPYCKVGGEVNNVVLLAYSNKGHEGFLGNAVLGEWCNLGADTNNSNLKNNYAPVKLWSYPDRKFVQTGLQFCGLIMGDHAKAGINTMFNTGTVVGVGANVFGAGFPRNFIPSFAWGGTGKLMTFKLDKVFEMAQVMMQRRGIELTAADREILKFIFDATAEFRSWEREK